MTTGLDRKTSATIPFLNRNPDYHQPPDRFLPWILTLSVAFGTLLFGFHAGFSSPTDNAIVEQIFSGNRTEADFAWSILNIGAMVGALICGSVATSLGRKPAILLNSIPYIVGATVMATSSSNHPVVFVFGRFVTGVGVGYSSVIVPLYIAEIAPSSLRGTLGCVNQLNITVGILIVAILGTAIISHPYWWQGMLVISFLFVVAQFVPILMLAPESPVWLSANGLTDEAKASLQQLRGKNYPIDNELESMAVRGQDAMLRWTRPRSVLCLATSTRIRRPILIGFGLMALQQWSGINGVIFNMKSLFVSDSDDINQAYDAMMGTIVVSAVQVVSTFIAVMLMDRYGRRQLLLTSCIGMTTSCIVMAISILLSWGIYFKVFALCVYIGLFSIGVGPLAWLLCSEIFPADVRPPAISAATVINWACSFLVTLTFDNTVLALGQHGLFFMYAAVCALGAVFVTIWVPETRGLSLQEIGDMW